ncbi:MAG: VOC family protein, partial [Pseudomonadota bacterium]
MKRLHLHITSSDLEASKDFYSALFNQAPTVEKPDYIKWMLDDPFVNIAISQRSGNANGIDHVGMQVDSDEALEALNSALQEAEQSTVAEPGANCCYAHSNKHWARDPQGVIWEMFHSMETIPTYYQAASIDEETP